MFIENMYTYRINGVVEVSATLPAGAELIEGMSILYPEEGYELERISDGERLSDIWLRDGDRQENYKEVEITENGG